MVFLKVVCKFFILHYHISSMILRKRNFKINCHKIKKTLQEVHIPVERHSLITDTKLP